MSELSVDEVYRILGKQGRLIDLSKSDYTISHKDGRPIFNANVVVGMAKVWFGDLDLAVKQDRDRLQELADSAGDTVYVLYEMDGRFEHEDSPLIDKAVEVFYPTPKEWSAW